MRWLKHITKSHGDEALAAVLHSQGLEGYGFYWLLLEVIAGEMDSKNGKPELTYFEDTWAKNLHCSVRVFRRLCSSLSKEKLILVENSGDRVKIAVPNILKYKDECAKKSGHSPEQRIEREIEIEREKENEKETPECAPVPVLTPVPVPISRRTAADLDGPPSKRWPEFWAKYPRKVNADAGCRAFMSVVTAANEERMFACLERYLASDESRRATMAADNWLFRCNRDDWLSDWPRAAPKTAAAECEIVGGLKEKKRG